VCGRTEGPGIRDLIGLWTEVFPLNETTDGLGISKVFGQRRRRSDAGAQLSLVVTAGDVIHLSRSLVIDILPHLVGVREQGIPHALDAESEDACVLLGDADLFVEHIADRELVLELRWRQGIRSPWLDAWGIEAVFLAIPLFLMHTDCGLDEPSDSGCQDGSDKRHVGECRGSHRIRPVVIVESLQIIRVFQLLDRMQDGIVIPIVLF
jgi:hypothetical protein